MNSSLETNLGESRRTEPFGGPVESRCLDIVEVLVENGARIQGIPLEDVLLTWDREIMQFFLDRGADPVTGNAFMIAFHNKVQRTLRSFVDQETHPELADVLRA